MMENEEYHRHPSHWERLSPRRLEHRVYLPTAITLHRLVPTTSRSTRSKKKHAPRNYEHLDPQLIESAQLKARHEILVKRLLKSESQDKPPATHANDEGIQQDGSKKSKKNFIDTKSEKSKGSIGKGKSGGSIRDGGTGQLPAVLGSTRPRLSIYRGIGETNLRMRQVKKLTSLIADCLQDLESVSRKTVGKRDFVAPYEIEIKKKRWTEFLQSSGRMLFTLKREVTVIERAVKNEEKSEKFLRMLASSSRTLHKLLLAVKTHSETALQMQPGLKLYNELKIISHRLFSVTSTLGLHPPNLKLKIPAEESDSGTDYTSNDSELATSEVSSVDLATLRPEYVRDRLSRIATETLKRKKRQENGRKELRLKERKNAKNEIILLPLKQKGQNEPLQGQRGQHLTFKKPGHTVTFAKDLEKNRGAAENNGQTPSSTDLECSPEHRRVRSRESPAFPETQGQSKDTANLREDIISDKPQPQTVIGCKMANHNELVEQTAEAVVSRLMPFIGQDFERNKVPELSHSDEKSSRNSRNNYMSVEEIDRQIQFMFERVCRIEDEQNEALDTLAEISQRREKKISYPEDTLNIAIKQAQNMLQNLASAKRPVANVDGQWTHTAKSIIINDCEERFFLNGGSFNVEKFVKDGDQDGDNCDEMFDNDDEHNDDNDDVCVAFEPVNDNIAEQIKSQKEEFWASLVNRGYIKPHDILADGKTAAKEAAKLLWKQKREFTEDSSIPNEIDAFAGGEREKSDLNQRRHKLKEKNKSTNVRRDCALAIKCLVDKSTLVTSLMSSGSNSSNAEATDDSGSSTKASYEAKSLEEMQTSEETKTSDETNASEETKTSDKKKQTPDKANLQREMHNEPSESTSDTNSGEVQSSRTEINDDKRLEESESASFPSYGGVSSSDKDV